MVEVIFGGVGRWRWGGGGGGGGGGRGVCVYEVNGIFGVSKLGGLLYTSDVFQLARISVSLGL